MFQMKEQDKTLEKELSDMEIDNLPVEEFGAMIIKLIQELRMGMDAQSEKKSLANN